MKVKWSKEIVIKGIKNRFKSDLSLSCKDVFLDDNKLYNASRRYFKTWENAILESGYNYEEIRKVKEWNKELIINKIKERKTNKLSLSSKDVQNDDSSLYNASCKHFENWKNAIEACGYDYNEIIKYESWTSELIINNIRRRFSEGMSINSVNVNAEDKPLYSAGLRILESWNNALIQSGFQPNEIKKLTSWTADDVLKQIKDRVDKGNNLNVRQIVKEDNKLYKASLRYFGSWEKAVNQTGLDYEEFRKHKPKGYWNKNKIISTLKERKNNKQSLKSNDIVKDHKSLMGACVKYFGSFELAIKSCNWDYEEIIENHALMSYYGHEFERILGEIFKELGRKYIKGYNDDIIPNFVFPNGEWADAKLSEWSIYNCDTIEKYEPFCKKLIIIYLRGNKETNKLITDKTSLISVYLLIQNLSENKLTYYTNKLDELWKKADSQEEIEKNEYIGTSQYKGVSQKRDSCRWQVSCNGIYLGYFNSEMEAAKVYDNYVIKNKLPFLINFGKNKYFTISGKSKFKGISWNKQHKKWYAYMRIDNKQKYIGSYCTEEEALQCRNEYILKNNLDMKLNELKNNKGEIE